MRSPDRVVWTCCFRLVNKNCLFSLFALYALVAFEQTSKHHTPVQPTSILLEFKDLRMLIVDQYLVPFFGEKANTFGVVLLVSGIQSILLGSVISYIQTNKPPTTQDLMVSFAVALPCYSLWGYVLYLDSLIKTRNAKFT